MLSGVQRILTKIIYICIYACIILIFLTLELILRTNIILRTNY